MTLTKIHIDISLTESGRGQGRDPLSYSTLDDIKGVVTIATKHDTPFDDLEIDLIGSTRTYVDKLTSTATISGRTEATHRFLRLAQPQEDLDLPESLVLQGGTTYRFPFNFVVPSQLLPKSCTHKCINSNVKEAHLQLPPTFGDPESFGYGCVWQDDLAPEMTKISYAIRARLSKDRSDGTNALLGEASKKLRIKPAFDEQPPLNVDGDESEYVLRVEKRIRKGLMKGRLGKLVIEASQPKSFRLPAVAPGESTPPITTMAKVYLRFDPHDKDALPPRLGSLSSKLKTTTFFASAPRLSFPKKKSAFPDMSQGYITDVIPLSTLCVASVEWTRHESSDQDPPPSPRRDSAISGTSTLSMSSSRSSASSSSSCTRRPSQATRAYYTATILVPLSLPTTKYFTPTFHSCIVSRVYALNLSLSLHAHALARSLTLKLPVQVSAEGSIGHVERRRQSEQLELAILEADEVFEPRAVGAGRSTSVVAIGADELPPGYDGLTLTPGRGGTGGGLSEHVVAGVAVFG